MGMLNRALAMTNDAWTARFAHSYLVRLQRNADATRRAAWLYDREIDFTVFEVPDNMSWQRYYTGTRSDLIPEDQFYHGTKAQLTEGAFIRAGYSANFGEPERIANHVYFTATLDAAIWGAELARGETRGRIYVVEPTGSFTDDPNLTDKKFPGNLTKSYRSRDAVCIIGEVIEWQGHALDVLQAMKDGIAKRDQLGTNCIDD